jgi:hypothetical protein
MKRGSLTAAIVIVLAASTPASALIEPGNVPAPSSNPYPTQPGVTVNGTLPPDSGSYHDLDYLKFTVTNAGETIQFTDANTTTGLNPNTCYEWCPVYLSLVDSNLTGLGDGAGTIATYSDTEIFDWTFQAPGTYYMVMESDGDVQLSYAVSYTFLSGGGTQGGTPPPGPGAPAPPQSGASAPLVRSLRVNSHQQGSHVRATITLGQAARSVRLKLFRAGSTHTIATLARAPVTIGRHRLELALPLAYQHALATRHQLRLWLRITVVGNSSATRIFNRQVTLSG